MNPGIYYFYEYENKQRRRNVGFLKISRHYHSCILQIHIRGIPAGNGASLELFAFCAGKGKVSGAQIATLTCFRRSVSARLPVSESVFPEGHPLPEIDGFLLRLPGESSPVFWAASESILPADIDLLRAPLREPSVSEAPAPPAKVLRSRKPRQIRHPLSPNRCRTEIPGSRIPRKSRKKTEKNLFPPPAIRNRFSRPNLQSQSPPFRRSQNPRPIRKRRRIPRPETEHLCLQRKFLPSHRRAGPVKVPERKKYSARTFPHSRDVSGFLPTTVFCFTDITTTIIYFSWRKTAICGWEFRESTTRERHGLPICSVSPSSPAITPTRSDFPVMSAVTEKTSVTGAAILTPEKLNDPVHLLIQTLCIAVCHSAHIVCHKKQAEIQSFRLASPLCLQPVCILVII